MNILLIFILINNGGSRKLCTVGVTKDKTSRVHCGDATGNIDVMGNTGVNMKSFVHFNKRFSIFNT